jgi:hypothetical protein
VTRSSPRHFMGVFVGLVYLVRGHFCFSLSSSAE